MHLESHLKCCVPPSISCMCTRFWNLIVSLTWCKEITTKYLELPYHQYWNLTGTPLEYFVVILFHGDSVVLICRSDTLGTTTVHWCDRYWSGSVQNIGSEPISHLSWPATGSPAPTSSWLALLPCPWWPIQWHKHQGAEPTLALMLLELGHHQGPALLCLPGMVHSCSPECCSWWETGPVLLLAFTGPTHPPAIGGTICFLLHVVAWLLP